jgi:hypothetical protein
MVRRMFPWLIRFDWLGRDQSAGFHTGQCSVGYLEPTSLCDDSKPEIGDGRLVGCGMQALSSRILARKQEFEQNS